MAYVLLTEGRGDVLSFHISQVRKPTPTASAAANVSSVAAL